jgi:hypothetical protein
VPMLDASWPSDSSWFGWIRMLSRFCPRCSSSSTLRADRMSDVGTFVPDRVVIVVPAAVAHDWPASVREFAVIAAFSTVIASASSVSAIVFAAWTIARCRIARVVALLLLLGDRELAAELARLGDHRDAAQERHLRELVARGDFLDAALGEQVGLQRRRQLEEQRAAGDAAGVGEHLAREELLVGERAMSRMIAVGFWSATSSVIWVPLTLGGPSG